MPALVVWEPLIFGGDDLRLISSLILLLRLVQISLIIFVVYHIINFNHTPEFFVKTGCIRNSEDYWLWYNISLAGCIFILIYGVIGAAIEIAMFIISGRGTPTETDKRSKLVPLCKCNMVPMMLVRTAGFIFAFVALLLTDRFCECASNNFSNLPEVISLGLEIDQSYSRCPTDDRTWYISARVLIATMACDAFFPMINLLIILRKRIHKAYRRLRPKDPRSLEEVQRSWQFCCKRCCECSSLMTCYLCGGQHLTAGSYADVAIALTDFLDDEGSLDIVPSDIAAALICLVNLQKQKQIEAKKVLLEDGGLFAKDRKLATKMFRQLFKLESTYKAESMRGVSASLQRSVSIQRSEKKEEEDDIEMGLSIHQEEGQTISEQLTDNELEHFRHMLLTRRETMQRIDFSLIRKESSMEFQPMISNVLSPQSQYDCLVLGEGSRYCTVALASYSWMMYLWTHKCTGCCELTTDSICHPRCCRSDETILGSDACGWKQATILKSLGIDEEDLLYANFRNEVGVNPYLILRDKRWKTIVLTVRGTLSFEDMITDVTVTPVSLEGLGNEFGFDGSGEWVHSGMLSGAKFIEEDLTSHNILEEVMKDNPDYGLRIIGHSLGAGVASVLGLMLRKQYPNLYVLGFSPPGCVFSERMAEESKEFVCSYVLHNDIVPRLSYHSLVNLRNDLVEIIARIKVPKHQVFDSNYKHSDESTLAELPDKLLHGREDIPASDFLSNFEEFKQRQTERQQERYQQNINMTLPGRIIQLVRTSTKYDNIPCSCLLKCTKCVVCCGYSPLETKRYKVRWTSSEDLSEIFISPTMMSDHFPYNISRALNVACHAYGVAEDMTPEHEQIILEGAKKSN